MYTYPELDDIKNGSQIIYISSSNNIRSKRSELLGFYCANCNDVHEDYPIRNIQWIGDNIMMCKESYNAILEPFANI